MALTGAILHLQADQGFTDLSDSSHTVTETGATIVSETGHGGTKAFNFVTGSSQYITIPHHADFNFGTGEFAIAMWRKTTASTYRVLANKAAPSGNYAGWSLRTKADTVVELTVYNSAADLTDEPDVSVWVHTVAQRKSGKLRIWTDGVAGGEVTSTRNVDCSEDLLIGKANSGWGGSYLDGMLDDIRVFARSLTSLEILQLASEPGYMEASGSSAGTSEDFTRQELAELSSLGLA